MTSTNPHPDAEYKHQRRPDCWDQWSRSFRKIWSWFSKQGKGQKKPLITVNVTELAETLGLSRKTIQRFLNLLITPGKKSNRSLALKVLTPGNQPNQYKMRWDFTLKRKKRPFDLDPCNCAEKAFGSSATSLRKTQYVYSKRDDTVKIKATNAIKERFSMTLATGSIDTSRPFQKLPLKNPDQLNWKPLLSKQIRETCQKSGFPWITSTIIKRIKQDELTLFEARYLLDNLFYLVEELEDSGFKPSGMNYRQIIEWIQRNPEKREEAWQKIRRGFAIVGRWIGETSRTARQRLNSLRQEAINQWEKQHHEPASEETVEAVKQKLIEEGVINSE